jgi:hypothetical protein
MKELDFIETELKRFDITDVAIAELSDKYLPLKINGIDDKNGYKVVKAARLDIKNYRVSVEKRRKELTSDALKFKQAVDGEARRIIALLSPIEDYLEQQEKVIDDELERVKREKAQAEAAKLQLRINSLLSFDFKYDGQRYYADYTDFKIDAIQLKIIDDNIFEDQMLNIEIAHIKHKAETERLERERKETIAKEEAARKAENERLEQIKKEQETERLRLAAIAKEQDRIREIQDREHYEQVQENKRLESIAKEQAEKDAALKAEAERIEALKNYEESKADVIEQPTILIHQDQIKTEDAPEPKFDEENYQPHTPEEKKAYKEGLNFAIEIVWNVLEQERNGDEKETTTIYKLAISNIRDAIERGLNQNWIICND